MVEIYQKNPSCFFQLAVSTTSNFQEKCHEIGSSLLQKHSGGVENQRNL